MDDVLYTWSPRMIKANDLVSLEEIAKVIIAAPDPVVIER